MAIDLSNTISRFYLETAFDIRKFGETVRVFLPGTAISESGIIYGTPTGEGYGTPTGEFYGLRGGTEIDCHITENYDVDGDDDSYELVQQLILSCNRDPNATNSEGRVIGGIAYPIPGMRILRSAEADPLQRPYHYVEIVSAESKWHWTFRFERKLERSAGVQP